MSETTDKNLTETVVISRTEYERLKKLEGELPTVIEQAKSDATAERFAALRARDAADPAAHAKRSAAWKKKHRDEYNAKRREQYKLKKVVTADAGKSPGL
jgi:hypothetical protein